MLLISLQDHNLPHVYLQKLQNDGYRIDDLVMLGWGTCIHSRRRSTSLASRVSNSSKIIFVGLVRLERSPEPSIPQRLSWPLLVPLNYFIWISSALLIMPHSLVLHHYMALSYSWWLLSLHMGAYHHLQKWSAGSLQTIFLKSFYELRCEDQAYQEW